MKQLIIIIIILTMFIFTSCANYEPGANGRIYECDYHTFSFNTKITTTINDKEVSITGDILTFIEDPLKMEDDTNIIAKADDSYNFIGQDDHAITVNGKYEITIHGNFKILGEKYDLYKKDTKVGYAEFNTTHTSGAIYEGNKVVAVYSKPFILNDYDVTIYDNTLCSDEAILMIVASYVSDYHYDD